MMAGEESLPLDGIRVCERSRTLAGRLAGLLLADQGAEVFALPRARSAQEGLDDYLDRNKTLLPDIELAALANSDILINDGKATGTQHSWQIALDDEFDLPADASDDLLNGMVGFYTDLGVTSGLLGRDVISTPLPLCSVYAAVLGATAVSAALTD
jgi:CoA-transferase family III